MSRAARLTETKNGLLIGLAYTPPPPRDMGVHAERIQSLLISKKRRRAAWDALIATAARRIAGVLLDLNDHNVIALIRWHRERGHGRFRSLCRAVRWGM